MNTLSTWKRTGIVRDDEGTTVTYSLPGNSCSIESRKRHIPHANGVGTWDHTSFFVLRDGVEVTEKQTLKEAKTYAESLGAKERGEERERERHKPSEWRVGHQYTVGLLFVRVYRIRDQAEPDHSGNRIWVDKIFDTDEEAQAEADRLNALEKSRKTD